ncbi:MAG: response regulator [Alphaproteobacteria bacterium]|nr:response regulator [Alphaproteobacteria bacterium]
MDDEALERLLEQVERHGRLAAWVWDPHRPGRYPRTAGMQRLMDLPPNDTIQHLDEFFERVHPEDRELLRKTLRSIPELGVIPDLSFRCVHRDGTVLHLRSHGMLVPTDEGHEMFMGTLIDVTERVAIEQQLVDAERSRVATQLAAGVAHDLGNWLTVVRHVADRLGDDNPVKHELDRALAPCFSLTRELLALAQERPAEVRRVEVGERLKALAPVLRAVLGTTVELVVSCPERAWISIDPTHLEGVVLNLAVNARDAMPDGGRLAIGVRVDGEQVVIEVADDGSGISPDRIPRVFEPYYTTKPVGRGSGLGLASVRGTVRQAGGEVRVHSGPGGGTTFEIRLPSKRAPRILVVDDLPEVRDVLREVLVRAGMAVLEAGDGQEALDRLDDDLTVDLVLTDLSMPVMDGEALTDVLVGRGSPPVVVVSGYGSERVARVVPVVRKPFRPAEVLDAVSAALR